MSNATSFARLFPTTHRAVRRMASKRKQSIPVVIDEAVKMFAKAQHPQVPYSETHGRADREMTPPASGANTSQSPLAGGEQLCSDVEVPSGKCVAACDSHQIDSSTKQASEIQEQFSQTPSTQRQAAREERKARSAGKHRPPAVS